jgi:hypothetical protein
MFFWQASNITPGHYRVNHFEFRIVSSVCGVYIYNLPNSLERVNLKALGNL